MFNEPQDKPLKIEVVGCPCDFKIPPLVKIIPPLVKISIDEWVLDGRPPGQFVQSVLKGDLFGAFRHGDPESLTALAAIVDYVYNKIPSTCWGSQEKMHNWANLGGQKGAHNAKLRQEQLILGDDN
jgi:hypothetical protein